MVAWWPGLATIGVTIAGVAASQTPPPPIRNVRAIALHGGITSVPGFLTDGGTAGS